MLAFDIGANRGDWVVAALEKGYKVIALEPGSIYRELVKNFIYNPKVTPLKFAVSDLDYSLVEFYEADEDGLSTLNKDWLTADTMPYAGKPFRNTSATTITLDALANIYGEPDLIKIDVEGAEWSVFRGMTRKMGMLAFEWTDVTIAEHEKQLDYLRSLGYEFFAPQFIELHAQEPLNWYPIGSLGDWVKTHSEDWVNGGWRKSNLRPTPDVGMCWVR
jgi:FkbM family methyltransferase